jgi:hypothetical protein
VLGGRGEVEGALRFRDSSKSSGSSSIRDIVWDWSLMDGFVRISKSRGRGKAWRWHSPPPVTTNFFTKP